MSNNEKTKPRHPEINFLPPLEMILTFFDSKIRKRVEPEQVVEEEQKEVEEKNVEKLIEKLSEKK